MATAEAWVREQRSVLRLQSFMLGCREALSWELRHWTALSEDLYWRPSHPDDRYRLALVTAEMDRLLRLIWLADRL